jgi:hypothetical protein
VAARLTREHDPRDTFRAQAAPYADACGTVPGLPRDVN